MTRVFAALCAIWIGLCGQSNARITQIEIAKTEPAFGGATFGETGAYQLLTGTARGELDPADPGNAIIQDIDLAPRNARGMVEYSTDIQILKPSDQSRGNRVLLFEVVNRGNKLAVRVFDSDISGGLAESNALANPGDGFLFKQGYTLIWFGLQQDVIAGAGRLLMPPVVAHNHDGSSITGIVRHEIVTQITVSSLKLSTSWFTGTAPPDAYPAASLDNRDATLTVRAREQDPRVPIPNDAWAFGKCGADGVITPDPTWICLKAGFQPGRLYELIYRAKDPAVMGIGFAAARDVGAFFRDARADSEGTANPVYRPARWRLLRAHRKAAG